MAIQITMPRLSDTMEEGTLVKWRVKVGDQVKSGDVLADVETDKATMELQSYDDGTVAKIAVQEGDSTAVGKLIAVLAEQGESVEDAAAAADESADQPPAQPQAEQREQQAEAAADVGAQPEKPQQQQQPEQQQPAGEPAAQAATQPGPTDRVRISPLAAKLAEEHELDLGQIQGTGPSGRIIKRDIIAAIEAGRTQQPAAKATAPAAAGPAPLEEKLVKVSNMRQTIARRLLESKTTIPHFTVTTVVDMDPLLDLRETLNEQLASQNVKLSVNDFIVRAAAVSLLQHPDVNSSWTDKGIQRHGRVNVGVAVALPEERGGGLVVPVIADAHRKGLRAIGEETRTLASKARKTGLSPEEMADGTFTVSNLGMFGVEHFEAIINPPQAAILAVGAALDKPVVRDGQIVVGREMTLTLSADHRVVDGAIAAAYLQTLKQMLEHPAALLV